MYLHSSNDIRPINFWSFFLHVIVLHFMDSKYLRFLYYQFSCVFDPSSSLFNFIFYCDILPVLCKNEALDQKYSNLCACTRRGACSLSMKSESDASWLSATFCQTLCESCHLARFFPSWKAFPSLCLVCQLLSSDWQSRLTLCWSSPLHHAKGTDGMREIGINKIKKV